MARLDAVSLSIIHNHLVNICREMGTAMMRTAYSPIFNRDGEMIAQAEFCPAQLGANLNTVRRCIAELGLESFEDGDAEFRTFQAVFGTISPARFANCVVRAGDQILLRSPGGGGYGPPTERDPVDVLRDVAQGFVSREAALAAVLDRFHAQQAAPPGRAP